MKTLALVSQEASLGEGIEKAATAAAALSSQFLVCVSFFFVQSRRKQQTLGSDGGELTTWKKPSPCSL